MLGLQLLATAGLALFLAAVTVYLRDLQQVLSFVLQLIFYTAPILYPLDLIPQDLRGLAQANPFTGFALAYRDLVLWGHWPPALSWLWLGTFALLALILGRLAFRRLQPGFSDVL